jgi:sporulation protein YlmC with PRC-barrel domain
MVGKQVFSLEIYHSGRITPLYFRKSNRFVVDWQQVKAVGEFCQTLRARPMAPGRLH